MRRWIFGYGSLIWRPAMRYAERRAARIDGWARRFWQASTDHRGTPGAPGRVLTLVPAPGASIWGMAYALDATDEAAILGELDVREQQGYDRVDLDVNLAADHRAGPIATTTRALMYIATETNPHFIGPEPLDATAAIVRRSHGPSGDNLGYVVSLAHALAELGAPDPDVDALLSLLG
jgi:cation transport regulator ChaC